MTDLSFVISGRTQAPVNWHTITEQLVRIDVITVFCHAKYVCWKDRSSEENVYHDNCKYWHHI